MLAASLTNKKDVKREKTFNLNESSFVVVEVVGEVVVVVEEEEEWGKEVEVVNWIINEAMNLMKEKI